MLERCTSFQIIPNNIFNIPRISSLDPYTAPSVFYVILLDTGDASIGWSPGGCSELFPYISYIFLREGSKTWTKMGLTSKQTHYNVSSVAFIPNTAYDFKVQLRYVVNDVNVFSDESEVYTITVPGRFY